MKLFKSFFARMAAALTEREQVEAELSGNYTPRARQVFALAEKEATRLNHNFIGTEHVLVGLVKLGQGVAANVLRRQGVDLEKVRTAVEEYVGRGPDVNLLHPIPFTPRVKTVLLTAQKEARCLYHTYVGTEHILLGLMRDGEGVAARVLEGLGLSVSQTRQEILKELDPNFLGGGELSQG
jgi:ATP-dependent Clp protease ATP-binding subunit ClpC